MEKQTPKAIGASALAVCGWGFQMIPETIIPIELKAIVSVGAFILAAILGSWASIAWLRQPQRDIKYFKAFYIGFFVCFCICLIPIVYYKNHPVVLKKIYRPPTDKDLELILNKNFSKQEVVLDRKHFVGCQFDNCTIVWNGDGYAIEKGNYFHQVNIKTSVIEAGSFLKLFRMLELFDSKKVRFEDGE